MISEDDGIFEINYEQQTVSDPLELLVILPCPFCGSDAEDLGDGYYCCSKTGCAAVSIDCTIYQWNKRKIQD